MLESHGPIGTLIPNQHINIVGGGISGLLMGYFLKKQNIPFTIHEKEQNIGGKIGTKSDKFGLAEKAANAIFSNDDVIEFLNELDIPIYSADRGLKKFVWRQGKPFCPPIKKLEILNIFLSLFKKIPKNDNLTIKQFFTPLLGETACDEILAPALGGIYAHDISDLHFESIFKNSKIDSSYFHFIMNLKKNRKRQESKATSISFDGGMQGLIDKLKHNLSDHIKTNTQIDGTKLSNLLICTDAIEAAEILKTSYPEISYELGKITYKEVTTATLISEVKMSFLNNSFGILFPPNSTKFNSLGILSNSEIYPHRTVDAKYHSYTFMVKGIDSIESMIKRDLESLNETAVYQHSKSLTLTNWKRGIPLYNLQRYNSVLRMRSEFNNIPPGLTIFGNYIDGISIRELLTMAKKFANSLK